MTCGALKESYGDTRQHGIVTFSNLRTATIVIEHLSHAYAAAVVVRALSRPGVRRMPARGSPLTSSNSFRTQARQVVHDSHVLGMELVVR